MAAGPIYDPGENPVVDDILHRFEKGVKHCCPLAG